MLAAASATGQDSPSGPIAIHRRPVPGTHLSEVWAEGDLHAQVKDVQDTLLDVPHLPQFMPYVKEARELGPAPGGGRLIYGRLSLGLAQGRDYVLRLFVDQRVGPQGDGPFQNHWVAEPDRIPKRNNLIRMRTNQGGWLVTPGPGGRSHAVYHVVVDPGGWLPGFALGSASQSAVLETFRAVDREAQRRARARPEG
jgi:hypothetical protein